MSLLIHIHRTVARNAARPSLNRVRMTSTRQYTSTMHDNDPEVLEFEKQKNLSGKQQTSTPHAKAPGWNESLASASEASVKADRYSDSISPLELQRKTVEYIQSRHSPEDRVAARETDIVDAVDGPLGSVKIHHDAAAGQKIKRKVVHEETEEVISADPTASEENVKADRGQY